MCNTSGSEFISISRIAISCDGSEAVNLALLTPVLDINFAISRNRAMRMMAKRNLQIVLSLNFLVINEGLPLFNSQTSNCIPWQVSC